jgi:hypothetical protein
MVKVVRWTDEMDNFLKNADQKLSYSIIAADMSRIFDISLTRNSLIGRANRLGLTKQQPEKKLEDPNKIFPQSEKKKIDKTYIPKEVVEYQRVGKRTDFPNPKARKITFFQLKATSCRFPIGDSKEDNLRFCGAETNGVGSAYCEYCRPLVYINIAKYRKERNERLLADV